MKPFVDYSGASVHFWKNINKHGQHAHVLDLKSVRDRMLHHPTEKGSQTGVKCEVCAS